MGEGIVPIQKIPKNYFFEITRGNVSGSSTITKFGFNSDIDTASTPEDIWNTGGVYVAPTAARVHAIVSNSVNDTSAGTGCRTVLVFGIIGDYTRVTETVTMNGTTPVNTVNSYLHIHLIQCRSVGSSGVNAGTITATAATDATITATILTGEGQTASSIFLIPAGFTGYITRLRSRMNCATANSAATIGVYTIPFGLSMQLKTQMGINNSGSSFVELNYSDSAPFIVPEKSWIRLRCTSVTNNNTSIEAEYDLILIQN